MSFSSSFPRSRHLTYRKYDDDESSRPEKNAAGTAFLHNGRPEQWEPQKRSSAAIATSYQRNPKRARIGNHKLVLNRDGCKPGGEDSTASDNAIAMKKVGKYKLVAAPTPAITIAAPAYGSKSTTVVKGPHRNTAYGYRNRNGRSAASSSSTRTWVRPKTNPSESNPTPDHSRCSDATHRAGNYMLDRSSTTIPVSKSAENVQTAAKNQPTNWKKLGPNKLVLQQPKEQPSSGKDAPSQISQAAKESPSFSWKKKPEPNGPICKFFQRKGMCLNPDCKFVHVKVNPRVARQQEQKRSQRKQHSYHR